MYLIALQVSRLHGPERVASWAQWLGWVRVVGNVSAIYMARFVLLNYTLPTTF